MKTLQVILIAVVAFELADANPRNRHRRQHHHHHNSRHHICPLDETYVPRKFNLKSTPEDFPLLESALQIYSHIRIPCDGWLSKWKFLVEPNHVITGLHLGIFRPQDDSHFELIGRSHFVVMPTPKGASWVTHTLKRRISVKHGDCVGIFYDKFQTPHKQLTIRSRILRHETNLTKLYPTFVLAMDESHLQQNRTVDSRIATKEFRNPALLAVIANSPTSDQVVVPQEVQMRSAVRPKEHLAVTQPDQSLFVNDNNQIKGKEEIELSMADDKCMKPNRVPEKFEKLPKENYQFAETSLQIFTSMRIECDGFLSGFQFLTANQVVDGVHLAIFRSVDPEDPKTLTIVEDSKVNKIETPEEGTWVVHLPESPISVQSGDLVGIYYDDYKVPRDKAAIVSMGPEDLEKEPWKSEKHHSRTYVMLKDGSTLGVNGNF